MQTLSRSIIKRIVDGEIVANPLEALAMAKMALYAYDEATDDMATAGARVIRDTFGETNQHARAKKIYAAMIKAAEGE